MAARARVACRCPAAPARPPSASGAASSATGRSSSSGSPRPAEHDPAELSDPRHFAYWRRAADVVTSGIVDADPRPARRRSTPSVEEDVDGHHHRPGLGRGRRQQRAVRRARHGPVRRRRPRRRPGGSPAASSATGWRGSSAGAAGRRWPGPRSPTSPTTCGDGASDARRARRPHPGAAARRPGARPTCPGREADEVVAIDWGMLGHGPVGADLGYYLLSAREEFEPLLDAYLMGLPDGLATSDEVTLGARVTAVYTVLTPGRVGAGAGRRRRGRAGREVPAPRRGAAPAGAAAAVPPDRGAAGVVPRRESGTRPH